MVGPTGKGKKASVAAEHVLTDNGREFCGRPLHHPYELFLAIHQIMHRNTKVHTPYTNGFCERFHRTVSNEFFKVTFRKKFYLSLGELQNDLDTWLDSYNTSRPHHGYRTQGRTPLRAVEEGLAGRKEELTPAA